VACTRALGAAELVAAALDDRFVERREPPERLGARIAAAARAPALRRRGAPAIAAALILAVGLAGGAFVERSFQVARDAGDGAVLATIASSHFEHVSFTANAPAAPVAKAIYARDGSWLFVVVDSASCGCRVVARAAGSDRDLGPPQVRGGTATLFVRGVPRPSSLALDDASGRALATATLVYPRP
jgi:hypothetical protein